MTERKHVQQVASCLSSISLALFPDAATSPWRELVPIISRPWLLAQVTGLHVVQVASFCKPIHCALSLEPACSHGVAQYLLM
jgi:hypothetical protein